MKVFRKDFLFSALVLAMLLTLSCLFLLVVVTWHRFGTLRPIHSSPVFCTLEAKLCPDGSAVGRMPPKCEFAPCPPQGKPTSETVVFPDEAE